MTPNEQIDAVLDHFDFERVEQTMVALKWTYGDDTEPPNQVELRRTARRLLATVIREKISQISTGGFTAQVDHNGYLILRFVVEEIAIGDDGELAG